MEAGGGIEPPHTGFADPRITTLLPSLTMGKELYSVVGGLRQGGNMVLGTTIYRGMEPPM